LSDAKDLSEISNELTPTGEPNTGKVGYKWQLIIINQYLKSQHISDTMQDRGIVTIEN